ncbi:retrovirus-related pol polyprotein from transposon TNT 1-94, partial [Tanacetum coccineum]
FDEKRGIIFNSNKEVVMIAPRVRDVYVLDMTSSAQESCFFAKDSKNLNWLWHKRLAHLNFKTINKQSKHTLVIVDEYSRKFDEKANDGYLLGYSLVSKAFKLTTSTLLKIKDIHLMNIFILMSSLHKVSLTKMVKLIKNTDEILNDDLSEHSNHTNDEQIIDNLPHTKDIQILKHLSSLDEEDTSIQNTIPIPNPSSSILSMVTPAPQDRWS